MLKKIKQMLFREKYVLVAFALTWIFLLVFSCAAELAPFGDNCLLTMDLHGQYYPMMSEKLSDFFSVWSWNGGLGFSAIVQSAYYTNSIFILLLLPFSGYARVAALHMMIFLKLALSAAAFAYYLGKRFEKYDVFTAVFGVAYGLGAYMLAFMNQPMWLDVAVFCPLILCAMERLIAGKSPIPYTLLLALAIYSNFYIAFSLCIFLCLWFVASTVMKKWGGFCDFVKTTVKFGLASVLAGALCAFSLIPLMLHMENWISSSVGFPEEGEWYHSFAEIADSFSAMAPPSWEYGPANIFCGSVAVFFVLTFLFNSKISLKGRIVMISLAALLFVSLEWSYLDFIWHGLHFPNQLPGRWSFLFILVVLMIGYETVIKCEGWRVWSLLVSLFGATAFFLIGMGKSENPSGRWFTLIMIFMAFALFIITLAVKNNQGISRLIKAGIALLLLVDICVNAAGTMQYVRVTSASGYVRNEEQMLLYAKKYQSGKDDFWRTELTSSFTFDCGQLYGYKGLTYYSSTMNGNTFRLMERLGNRVYARNVSTVYMPTPFQDMMFGVKYHYMQNGKTLTYGNRLEKANNISVYESPYALPIAYAVAPNIKKIEQNHRSGLVLQEYFVGLAANMKSKLTTQANLVEERLSNGTMENGAFYVWDIESPMVYTAELEVNSEGSFFLDFDFTVGEYKLFVNERSCLSGRCGSEPIVDVGHLSKGDKVTVTVTIRGYGKVVGDVEGYTVNGAVLDEAYEKLSSQALQVEYASDTEIRGEITLAEDGVLYASIPAENGWEVYIDGVKTETYDLGLGLLFCDIEAGTHTVEYRYRAPGLALGAAISSVAALCTVGLGIFDWIKKKKAVCLDR